MYGGHEGREVFGITGGNTAPLLEVQESVFDQMPVTIQMLIEVAERLAVSSRWDLSLHPLFLRLLDNGITVIALVRNQVLGLQAFNQG